jgi:hypothetical protein
MAKTIARAVAKPVDAQRLIDDLVHDCLCQRADMSVMVMVRDPAGWWTHQQSETAAGAKRAIDTTASGAKSLVDGLFEGLEAVSRALPGGGVLRVFGSLVAVGIAPTEARYYGEAFERGAMLVIVQAMTDRIAQCARQVMTRHGALAPAAYTAP